MTGHYPIPSQWYRSVPLDPQVKDIDVRRYCSDLDYERKVNEAREDLWRLREEKANG